MQIPVFPKNTQVDIISQSFCVAWLFLKLSFAGQFQHIYVFLCRPFSLLWTGILIGCSKTRFISSVQDRMKVLKRSWLLLDSLCHCNKSSFQSLFCLGFDQKGGARLRVTKCGLGTWCCWGFFDITLKFSIDCLKEKITLPEDPGMMPGALLSRYREVL